MHVRFSAQTNSAAQRPTLRVRFGDENTTKQTIANLDNAATTFLNALTEFDEEKSKLLVKKKDWPEYDTLLKARKTVATRVRAALTSNAGFE